ncbi:MAG: helix-turn-helix transcriptional regulator [Thermoproteota archaeon]|jgi:DNA-binding HxlR family transcriptional regulator|nr:helix-turn-helix transcriptional regulator [Thermoproteota archaeon]
MVNKYSVARTTEEEAGEVVGIWEVLGRRWSLLILKNLCTKEVIRFNEFKKLLSGISSTVLADRLLELEREGLVSKKIYPQIPPKVEYSLTIRAKELGVILRELGKWASRWKVPRITTNTKTTSAARSAS